MTAKRSSSSKKIRFLIAYGPTREPLDPVRYLSNYSTGTMGKHLVAAAKKRGHTVRAVECPSEAESARDLEKILKRELPKNDVLIMAAAVCDVRPAGFSKAKIKKDKLASIAVVKNPDILARLAKNKKKGQTFVGFGLESENIRENGLKKIRSKNLELILLQQVTSKKNPFGEQKIDALLLTRENRSQEYLSVSKARLTEILIREIEKRRL